MDKDSFLSVNSFIVDETGSCLSISLCMVSASGEDFFFMDANA